jgi:hypothetical protein
MNDMSICTPSASGDVQTRLRLYSLGALGVAGGALALLPQQASAGVIPFEFEGTASLTSGTGSNASVALPDNGDPNTSKLGVAWTGLDSAGANDPYLAVKEVQTWDHNTTVEVSGSNYAVPSVLNPGFPINPTEVTLEPATNGFAYIVLGGQPLGDWVTSFEDKIIGFETQNGNLGFLNVSWNVETLTLTWKNGGLITTDVPEPTTLALLAAGAVGLARRRRASQALAA